MIISIAATYHLTIFILDVTNAFQNTSKASSERLIIDCPAHYVSWFKFHFPNICTEPDPNGLNGMEIWCGMQVT